MHGGRDVANDASTVFDLVILGGGSGGYAAALRGAQLGLDVALIEKGKVGGTCLHNGCIPTKALLHAGEIADQARESEQFGVKATFEGIDMAAVHKYKDDVVSGLYKGLQGLIASRKVTYIEGEGRLSSPTSVDVNGRRVQGRHVLLATGSVPKSLPGLEIDGDRIISSDHALVLDRVPKSAIVLGGGVIGVEFASAWKSFGTDVTIVEGLKHLVPVEDENSSKLLERAFRKRGIKFNRVHPGRRQGHPGRRQGVRGRGPARRHRPRPGLAGPGLRGGRGRHGPRLRPRRRVHADQRPDHLRRR
jgi:dihydrolipoamide dehydrogenase